MGETRRFTHFGHVILVITACNYDKIKNLYAIIPGTYNLDFSKLIVFIDKCRF